MVNMRGQNMSVYTISAAGNANFGDEIILKLWTQAYLGLSSNVNVISDVLSPEAVEASWYPSGSRITFTGLAWKIAFSHARPPWKRFVLDKCMPQAWFRDIMDPGHPAWSDGARRLLRELERYCLQCDVRLFHLLGGGYLTALWPCHYLLLGVACLIARRIGARVVVTGQGFMPASERHCEAIAQYSDVIDIMDCRDEPSRKMMSAYVGDERTSLSGDDTLLCFGKYSSSWNPRVFEQRALVVSIQNDLFHGGEQLKRILASPIVKDAVVKLGLNSLVFVPCMSHDIQNAGSDVWSALNMTGGTIRRFPLQDVLRNGFPYYPNGYYITSRYHPHLMASLMGGRGCAFHDTEYYRVKHESVSALSVNPWPLVHAHSGFGRVAEALGTPAFVADVPTRSEFGIACQRKKTGIANEIERRIDNR